MTVTPLGEYVVAIQQTQKTQTTSGIYIPESAQEKQQIAIVVEVGKNVKEVRPEDKIVYKVFSTTELKFEGQAFILIKEEDILAKVEK